jgi:RNA polymerase sigma factor (sigma-70 family)
MSGTGAPLTVSEITLLDSVISAVTRTRRMPPQDAEDFRQTVFLRLMERRGDIFTRFRGESSLQTYLFVVVRRLRFDWQNQAYGKWRPSLTARREGSVAIVLDRLLNRDGYTVEEAIEHLRASRLPVDEPDVRRLAAVLPGRRRTRIAATEFSEVGQVVGFDDPVEARQDAHDAGARKAALLMALGHLDERDRDLIRLRFYERLTVQAVAARTRTDPKRLYRRFDRIMGTLRRELTPTCGLRGMPSACVTAMGGAACGAPSPRSGESARA